MADLVARLKIESGDYDSKIKRAQAGLLAFEKECRAAGKSLNTISKDNLEFVKGLGQMETVSNSVRGKLAELTSAFTDLSVQYNHLTEEEKKGDFGKALSSSLDQLKVRIKETKADLNGVTRSLGTSGGGLNQLFSGVAGKFGMSPAMFTGVGAAIAGIGTAAKLAGDNIRTAFNFEKSMSMLSSLTGKTGKDLEQLKEYAIELGSTTTLTASQVADAFRLIGSQQPQLLESSEALKEVTKYAIRLSEAAGIDLATASQTLSTSINQMGGDSNNAARYVNVLAAASQKGAGDIAWLGEALTKSATAAKAVGTDYEELVANLEQLAKGGFDASTAGTALRSIIMNLEKQANNDFKPSIVGLTQAFENLGKANLDIVGYQQLVGKMFASQAKVLSEAAGEAKNMTEAITGTNIAEEQAKTNTENLDGAIKALASAWEGLNLHINSSNGFLKTCVDWLKDTVRWADRAFTSAGKAAQRLEDIRGGAAGSENDRIQKAVNEVRDASQENRRDVYNKHDEFYTSMESYAWKKVNELNAQIQKFGNFKFDWKTGTRINLKDEYEKYLNAANDYRKLGEEFRSKAKQYLKTPTDDDKISLDVEADTEDAQKSIEELQAKIKELKKLRDEAANAGDTKMVAQYNAQIKSIQAQIKAMRGETTTKNTAKELSPLQQTQKQISELSKEALTADDARLEVIKKEVAALNEQLKVYKAIQNEVNGIKPDFSKPVTGDKKVFESEQRKIFETQVGKPSVLDTLSYQTKKEIKLENIKVDTETLHTILKDALQKGIDTTALDLTPISEQIGNGVNIPDKKWQEILDKYNELRKAIGEKPIKIDFETGKVKDKEKDQTVFEREIQDTQKVVSGLSSVTSGLQQLGVKLPEGVQQFMSGIQGLMSIINGVTSIIQVFSTSTATAQIAATTTNTAMLGALTAAVSANTAALGINSALSFFPFANGGIVGKAAGGMVIPGNNFSGDNLRMPVLDKGGFIGVNSGEVILNKAQAGVIASDLQGMSQIQGSGGTPYVSGEQIYLGLNNWGRRTGRGELVFSRD